jgi:drug/metabolite transporter (DMT)-like permease
MISLFSDGMLASVQQQLMNNKKIGKWEMMQHIGMGGFLISLTYAIVSGDLGRFITFIGQYPSIINPIIVLSCLGVLGQFFIFYCIRYRIIFIISKFSPRVLSIVTTTRKFFTVLVSIFIFGHVVSPLQWGAITLVATGVSWELY